MSRALQRRACQRSALDPQGQGDSRATCTCSLIQKLYLFMHVPGDIIVLSQKAVLLLRAAPGAASGNGSHCHRKASKEPGP